MDEFMQSTKSAGHIAELKRLANNHEVYTDAMGGLLLAPIDLSAPGLKILDSATADGLWLRDLRASASSQHKYVGTDIESELFPSGLPKDLTLVKHSFLDPWPSGWNGTFDLVHQRLGLAGAGQVPLRKVVEGLAGLCKSGGWVELAEMDVQNIPAGNGPALTAALRLLREVLSAAGPGGDIASRLKSLLEGAGLEKVEERRIKCSVGSKAQSHLVEKSVNGLCDFIAPMTAVVEKLPTSFTAEELSGLESRLREELTARGGTWDMVVAFGSRP